MVPNHGVGFQVEISQVMSLLSFSCSSLHPFLPTHLLIPTEPLPLDLSPMSFPLGTTPEQQQQQQKRKDMGTAVSPFEKKYSGFESSTSQTF